MPQGGMEVKKIDRTGEERVNNQGLKMKIIKYVNRRDIDVEFEDGSIRTNVCYDHFINGVLSNISVPDKQTKRIGEKRVNNQGLEMEIIAYRNARDMDVKFEDSTILNGISYSNFKKGKVKNPNNTINKIGEKNIMNNGQWAEIIAYRSYTDIDIKFDDGAIKYNIEYGNFKKGKVSNIKIVEKLRDERVGEKKQMNRGMVAEIIEYRSANDISVRFEDGTTIEHSEYIRFQRGEIKNPYQPKINGVGCIGKTTMKVEDGNDKLSYRRWRNMLDRCYNPKDKQYKIYGGNGVTVCKEWQCYESFEIWWDEHYYELENERVELDKDILIEGNKVYSPETCIFVPQKINSFFSKGTRRDKNSELPMGVIKYKSKYKACIVIDGKNNYMGIYDTIKEAEQSYKKAVKERTKKLAEIYKDKIPQKLYDRLIEISNN